MNNDIYINKIQHGDIFTSMDSIFHSLNIHKNTNIKKIGIKINLCDYRFS